MNWPSQLSQFSLEKNKKLLEVRAQFLQGLELQTTNSEVAYYDFLLVAKQIGLRFEEAKHLMSLKAYFMQNNNSIDKQKLCSLLMVKKGSSKDKYIVKFALPHHISPLPPIQQQQEQCQQATNTAFQRKKQMIVELKMLQFQRIVPDLIKIRWQSQQKLKECLRKQSVKMQETDFQILTQQLHKNQTQKQILETLRDLYFSKINEDLLGNVVIVPKKSGTQLLQIIQPSVLSMELETAIIKSNQQPRRKVNLAPLRFMKKSLKELKQVKQSVKAKGESKQNFIDHIHKISKIVNENKEAKRYDFDTNANRLRRLFVQQVIIPFEKKNDEEVKKRYPKPSISLEVSSQRIS